MFISKANRIQVFLFCCPFSTGFHDPVRRAANLWAGPRFLPGQVTLLLELPAVLCLNSSLCHVVPDGIPCPRVIFTGRGGPAGRSPLDLHLLPPQGLQHLGVASVILRDGGATAHLFKRMVRKGSRSLDRPGSTSPLHLE